MENHLEKFKRTDLSEDELAKVAQLLGAAVEPPSFWSAIANDGAMPLTHRRMALLQLIRRHVRPGITTIGAFAEMLDGAEWLGNGDITVITTIAGKIPVAWSLEDTIIVISLPGNQSAIYLTIEGRFTAGAIAIALHGQSRDGSMLAAVIKDAAVELSG